GDHALFRLDLGESVGASERRMRRLLDKIDRHVGTAGVGEPAQDAPPAIELAQGMRALDLSASGVSTVIWATGYRRSYAWLNVGGIGEDGEIEHTGGATPVPGLYAVGLRFQHRRKSHFIDGVGDDAQFVAGHIHRRWALDNVSAEAA